MRNAHAGSTGGWTRRQVLKSGALLAAATACGHQAKLRRRVPLINPWPHLAESPSFPVGVSSGDAKTQSVCLVSQLDGESDVLLSVMEVQGNRAVREVTQVALTPAPGGMLAHELTGLLPSQDYAYAFLEQDASGNPARRSNVGQFRTAPPLQESRPLLFTASSCAKNGYSFSPLSSAAQVDADFHLLLGDTSYNDKAAPTLEGYRDAWRATLGTVDYRQLRAATSMMATWDDHEVTNDWRLATVDPRRLAAAQQTLREYVPMQMAENVGFRVWRSLRWGNTAEIFLLDLRSEERGDKAQYISCQQMDFLKDGLRTSKAAFKIIVNSVPISQMPMAFGPFREGRWTAYPEQREEILSFIDDTPISGVLWVSGDVHMPVLGRVSHKGPGSRQLEVMVGPAAQITNPLWPTIIGPQWDYVGGYNNTAAIGLDPQRMEVSVTFLDRHGVEHASRVYSY